MGKINLAAALNWIIWGGGAGGTELQLRGPSPDARSEGLKRVRGSGRGERREEGERSRVGRRQ